MKFQKVFFFYVPLVLHTIGEDERAFLHCTSSVMLQIPSFYRALLPPPPPLSYISAVSIQWANSKLLQ